MFLLVSVRHVGAHPDELQHGFSIQSSINLGKTFPRISRIRIILSTQILARVFVCLPPFIPQIQDFICRMVVIVILIYFEWRDTENQQYSWIISDHFVFTENCCLKFKLLICFKVMLHKTIRNGDLSHLKRNTALECWNNVATIPFNVATML